MNHFAVGSLLLLAVLAAVSGFQSPADLSRSKPLTSSTAVYGIFDQMKKSMESGYAGGDDSPYAKIKDADAKKEEIRQKKAAERKKRGFKNLNDVKEKTFVKLKYNDDPEEEEPPKEEKKKLFGLF